MTHNDEFIAENRHRRVEEVALEIAGRKDLDTDYVLRQIEGWQRMSHKVPQWAATEGIIYPPRLALEQCSGQRAAAYKAETVRRLLKPEERRIMADITAGMGVDFSCIAPLFERAVYVERKAEIVETARHNMPLLGIKNVDFIEGNGLEVLQTLQEPLDLLFLDPARRDAHGGKTVCIEDCEPDIAANIDLLLGCSRLVMVKLSPMLDIAQAVKTLHRLHEGCVKEVHVIATGGECKELLLVMGKEHSAEEPRIHCYEDGKTLVFKASEESVAHCEFCDETGSFLYEPGPAVMKAGAFKTIAQRYGLKKLHPNSHLYTSTEPVCDFPGRTFRIIARFSFAKADLKRLADYLKRDSVNGKGKTQAAAHLAVRNFPATVAELRKRLKIREGGNDYLFATTLGDGTKCIFACRKEKEKEEEDKVKEGDLPTKL